MLTPESLAKNGTEDNHQAAFFCWAALPEVQTHFPEFSEAQSDRHEARSERHFSCRSPWNLSRVVDRVEKGWRQSEHGTVAVYRCCQERRICRLRRGWMGSRQGCDGFLHAIAVMSV
jgi:hypothetical protein